MFVNINSFNKFLPLIIPICVMFLYNWKAWLFAFTIRYSLEVSCIHGTSNTAKRVGSSAPKIRQNFLQHSPIGISAYIYIYTYSITAYVQCANITTFLG